MNMKIVSQIAYIAVLLFNGGTFLMFLTTWRLCSENYDRLPDRIPIHFGLSGKADGWARKSRFTVFWPPVAIVALWVIMLLPAAIEMGKAQSFFIPLLFFFSLISFALSVMFYNITRGTIDYSLGRATSIWPYIAKPLIFVIISTFSTPLLPVLISLQRPVLKEAFTSEASWTSKKRPAERREFGPSDSMVYLNLRFADMNGNPDVSVSWKAPDGNTAFVYRFNRPYRDIKTERVLWCYISLDYFRKKGVKPGEWTVSATRKGKPLKTLKFTVRNQ